MASDKNINEITLTSCNGPLPPKSAATNPRGIQIIDATAKNQPIISAQAGYLYVVLYETPCHLTRLKTKMDPMMIGQKYFQHNDHQRPGFLFVIVKIL